MRDFVRKQGEVALHKRNVKFSAQFVLHENALSFRIIHDTQFDLLTTRFLEKVARVLKLHKSVVERKNVRPTLTVGVCQCT